MSGSSYLHNKLYTEIARKKKSESTFIVISYHKEAIKNFFRQNLVRRKYDPSIEKEAFKKYL